MSSTMQFQLGDVIYNAAAEQFETLATLHRDGERIRVACSFAAPLTTEFTETVRGLLADAARQVDEPGLRAHLTMIRRAPRAAPRPDARWHHAILDRVKERFAA